MIVHMQVEEKPADKLIPTLCAHQCAWFGLLYTDNRQRTGSTVDCHEHWDSSGDVLTLALPNYRDSDNDEPLAAMRSLRRVGVGISRRPVMPSPASTSPAPARSLATCASVPVASFFLCGSFERQPFDASAKTIKYKAQNVAKTTRTHGNGNAY